MTDDSDPQSVDYGLAMPFVVCRSKGGPYDDEAFVNGVRCGQVSEQLEVAAQGRKSFHPDWPVPPALVPQLDLLAMRYGYQMTSKPWADAPAEWVFVSFGPAPEPQGQP
ncbi:MAG TPA: hypothetical protein VGW74_06900 [Propionibacteriaceae bacterium]|nr:hypothetical protein [Propionibacteriaceae bacterium]